MKAETISNWQVYHLVQPYFFAHHHFHKRKVDELIKVGIDAKILSVVPKELYFNNYEKYNDLEKKGIVKIIVAPSKRMSSIFLFLFLMKNIFNKNNILIHALRVNPFPILLLREIPFFKSKLRYVQEFEGDNLSEFVYSREFNECPRPPEVARKYINKIKYKAILWIESFQVKNADGLVLMSAEHANLWQSRLAKKIRNSILPTLSDPEKIFFDEGARKDKRAELQVENNVVLVYTGNVLCLWQRREEMCRFVESFSRKNSKVRFLAIVRRDDLLLMKNTIKKYKIEKITILKTVDHKDMYKYLSAADIALFLRHDHTMNKVVTSGKLAEYLYAGLPVITTGNNAQILNDYIVKEKCGFFINDSLDISCDLLEYVNQVISNEKNTERRKMLCKLTVQEFNEINNPFEKYVFFIQKIITGDFYG